ncbi:MAG: type IX secretion system sortase PorU [Bacteroidaceae bacterium]|nr:type IX secretion system sortase PorU [Bacteroidaceae bacterium]
MNRYIALTAASLMAIVLPVSGQVENSFTRLDWSELRIDSVLPVYSEVVPLESDWRLYDYTVQIEYPEYAPLSKSEAEVAARFDSLIGPQIDVESHVGVLRGKGMLDLTFVPIVRRGGQYEKLLSGRIMITPVARSVPHRRRVASTPAERYAQHSALAAGRWVKIGVTTDGMYQLTRQALRKMGFTKPEKVKLYGYGGHRQSEVIDADTDYDDLEEVPLYYSTKLDAWLFWGNGLVHWTGNTRILNHYAREACYFLTEGEQPAELATLPVPTAAVQHEYTSFTDHLLYEKDEFAWFTGGRDLYESANFANSSSRTYRLSSLSSDGDERLTVAFTAGASTATTLTTSVNGTMVGEMTLAPTSKYIYGTTGTNTYSVASLANADVWNIQLSTTAGNDARLDYLALHYTRRLALASGFVAFSQTDTGTSRFSVEAPSGSVVMRLGWRGEPAALVSANYSDETKTLSAVVDDATSAYVCFDPTYSFPQPSYLGAVENQDLHALDSLDMVIIISASGRLLAQAERLAEAHRRCDGLRVSIVRADQVYNEFSSGTPDATAYRRLMKMLYDRGLSNDTAPRYLLLMGDCAWDNRMLSSAWRSRRPDDYLLCFESENSLSDTRCYVMEDYFGLLDDGEGASLMSDKSDIGIGRFPVTTEAEARVMVDKCIAYMENSHAGQWKNLVCIMGDDGDENEHMRYADDVAKRIAADNPEMDITKVMWDAYKRISTTSHNSYPEVTAILKNQMEEGALVMNYTGHGSAITLSHEYVLNLEDFQQTQGAQLPLWVTAACDIMPFDGSSDNIGEAAVLNPSGGALAFYGTTRTVYASQNLQMNRYFMRYLFARDAAGRRYRLGDAIWLAKNAIIADKLEGGIPENKLHYALLGDPALTIGAPLERVVLDSINGQSLATSLAALRAGARVHLSGHVEDASGAMLSGFDGVVSMRLCDSEQTLTCMNNANATNPFSFADRGSALFVARDSVRNGLFTFDFVMPQDINYSDATGRATFYALSNDRLTEANGYSERFYVGGTSDELAADTLGPSIFAYLNNEDFTDGDAVNSAPYFVATLSDESGVNFSGNGIGHDLMLCVDGRADLTYNLNNHYVADFGDFTRGTVSFSLPALSPGSHTLTFRAWDVLNNSRSTTLNFVVDPALKPSMVAFVASPNPLTTATTFLITHDFRGAACTYEVEVFDFAGRLLWTHSETGATSTGTYSIPWNLTTATGRLGSGIYLCRCSVQCDRSKRVSKTQKIIVINNK